MHKLSAAVAVSLACGTFQVYAQEKPYDIKVCSIADGHKVVGATAGNAQGWNWKFLGGSGKWEGIEGGGTGKPAGPYPRLSPTLTAGCGIAKGT